MYWTLTGRQEEHVLDEARKHVPRLHVHERADKVQPVRRHQRNHNVAERRVRLNNRPDVLPVVQREGRDGEVHGVRRAPQRDRIA